MRGWIGIRRETKDRTQRRVPLTPAQVRRLIRQSGVKVVIQPWDRRIFPIEDYQRAGALISEDLSRANIIFGVKEISPEYIGQEQAYCFFSHVVKGQPYNMPMLRTMMDRKATLLDYELVRGAEGKRVVFFGDYAGYAGMIDTLWALGQRLSWEGFRTPFQGIQYASAYESLADAEAAVRAAGRSIRRAGLPAELTPLVCAFTGYGRVASGAQKIFDSLPVRDVAPPDLPALFRRGNVSRREVYRVVMRKGDMYRAAEGDRPFSAEDFSRSPEKYRSRLPEILPYLTLFVNGIYWEPRYPRLLTRAMVRALMKGKGRLRLRVIGDITCDVQGSVELTVKTTDATNPVYVVDPRTGRVSDGWEGRGPVILAVDKLPTELPREASEAFGRSLLPFVPALARSDFAQPTGSLRLPEPFRDALIVHRGRLTRQFRNLRHAVKEYGSLA